MDFYKQLGANIRTARKIKGLSLNVLAEHLDITYQQLQKYECGTNRIPLDKMIKACSVCEVSVLDMLNFDYPNLSNIVSTHTKEAKVYKPSQETLELVKAFVGLPDHVRPTVLDLIKNISDSEKAKK